MQILRLFRAKHVSGVFWDKWLNIYDLISSASLVSYDYIRHQIILKSLQNLMFS